MVNQNAMPQLLAEIAEVAGADAAWALAREYGGTKVYIPASVRQDHWLALLVGLDPARLICDRFGGNDLVLPHAKQHHARMVMAKALEDGATANEAARASGMTTRTAFRARARRKSYDTRQGKLFD